MGSRPYRYATIRRAAAAATLAALTAMPARSAVASDPLGLYLGGAVGESRVEADGADFNAASFKENHTAFKVMAGIRPISSVGVEVAYVDFGHPSGTLGGNAADVTMKGAAAFGMLYLPVPVVEVYVKLGLARLDSTVNGVAATACALVCLEQLFQLNRTNTGVAGGVGVQFKTGSFAVRGEYERFDAAGGNPGVLSLGVTWTFE